LEIHATLTTNATASAVIGSLTIHLATCSTIAGSPVIAIKIANS